MRAIPIGCVLFALGGSIGQIPSAVFDAPIEREIRSGDTQEYTLALAAGDLVSGTVEMRRVAAIVDILAASDTAIHTDYFFPEDQPVPRQIGFVAPAAGTYRIRIRTFDRFDGGPQWHPGDLVPVVGAASGSYRLLLERHTVAARMRSVDASGREIYSSPRLRRVAQEVEGGSASAVEALWREVLGKGPLVEEIPNNNRDVDVTFLWRAIYDTRNVQLTWCPRSEDCYMSHLAGTDIWFKTLRLRRGSRFSYQISPNDRPQDRWATAQLDPLNPRRFPDDPTYHFVSESVLDLPGAPDEQWALRVPARRGVIEERKAESALLNIERDIWVYTPPGYTRSAGPYPLLLLFDGAAYVSDRFGNAPATLDNLINDGRIKPTVVCFDPGNRGHAAGLAGARKYGDAILQELLPWLRASYALSTNPADVVIGGFSAGGRAAAQIAFFHPEVFGNVLSQSGAFREAEPDATEPNTSAQTYLASPRKPIRFYLEAGVYDNVPNAGRPLHEFVLDETNLQGNRHLRDVLRAKGYEVIYREVPGDHDMVHWRAMLADGLMALLGK